MPQCPTDSTLEQLLAGGLPTRDAARLREHAATCRECQAALDRISDSGELDEWRLAEHATRPLAIAEPALKRLITALHDSTLFDLFNADTALEHADAPLTFLGSPRAPGELGTLGPYRVLAELGRGGMGIVLQARDPELDRTVAIKVLRPDRCDDGSRARFVREAQSAARVRHENVVTVFSVASPPDGPPYFVMEHIAGPTLRDRIATSQRLDPREAAEIAARVADGLAAAHAAGLVHRDVKPGNILLGSRQLAVGSSVENPNANSLSLLPLLADFGLARLADAAATQLTQAGTLAGTPTYMSPEQVRDPNRVDARTDIYGLGVTLYETLTGEVPFRGAPHMVLRQIETDEPRAPRQLNDAVPRDLETICLKAMAKDVSRRYDSARALGDDLRRWLRGEPIQAKPVGSAERLVRWCRRNPRVAVLNAAVAALLATVAAGSMIATARVRREQQETERERLAAVAAGNRATEAARLADERGTVALDTLNDLIFKLQTELSDQPATLKVREQLLETALAGLDRVTSGEFSSPGARHSMAVAHLRMGDILWLGGRSAEARLQYTQSLELAERQCEADADNSQAWRDLAYAHELVGNLSQQATETADATNHYERSLEIRAAQAASHPLDAEVRRELAMSHVRLGDVHSVDGDSASARAAYTRATQIFESLAESHSANRVHERDLVLAYRRLSYAESLAGDSRAASDHLQKGIALADALAALDPNNATWHRDRILLEQNRGVIELASGDIDAALATFHRVLDGLEPLATAEPNNAERQWDVELIHSYIAGVERSRGEVAAAVASLERMRQILEPLVVNYPSSLKYRNDLVNTLWSLGDCSMRQGDHAAAGRWCERIGTVLCEADRAGTLLASLQPAKVLVEKLIVAFPLVPRAADDLDFARSHDSTIRTALLVLRAYELARRGEHVASAATSELVQNDMPNVSDYERGTYWICLARSYSLCLNVILRDEAASSATAELRRRYLLANIGCLREAGRAYPMFISGFRSEPELTSVCATPEFAALMSELQPVTQASGN